ncbi:MAG: S8 family serine peptidase, partial [Haloferacaceae archaeon]
RTAFYRSGDQPVRGSARHHDAKVASVVAGTAPDAELYLAEVGDAPTASTYREAIEWLVESDVDVIVDAGSYAPSDGESRRVFGWAATRAAEEDVLFVTSAGNYGDKHWSGETNRSGWVSFAGSTEANQLGNGSIEGRVAVQLYWEGDDRFDLYLFKRRPEQKDAVIDRAVGSDGAARIDATVPEGAYYVAIHAPEEVDAPQELRLFSLRQPLTHTDPRGSVLEPAATESVLAVGADAPDTPLRVDSSRLGTTITGPGTIETSGGKIAGTSAAAPYVAGTAALVQSADATLSPTETRTVLSSTGEREGDAIVVDPDRAVSAVQPEADITGRDESE